MNLEEHATGGFVGDRPALMKTSAIGTPMRRKSDDKASASKYHREIKPGVWVDVYDVLAAWGVSNPALQHLIKKALQPGNRGHKSREQDLDDIVASAKRAREIG